ncbi:WavE lipopolysaccharide synthesis family protein [Ureibacillus chungkukjangi]|uniref:WavE lipopolysaccharide synthesis family protein n=1 Tax=Ureibacillus chungkukjangi TaxID=1202712 RepID=UPI00384C21B3
MYCLPLSFIYKIKKVIAVDYNNYEFYFNGFLGKKIVIWANKNSLPTLEKYKFLLNKIHYIVVVEKELWGKKFYGIPIIGPQEIVLNKNKDRFVVLNLIKEYWKSATNFLYKYGVYQVAPLNLFQSMAPYTKQIEDIQTTSPKNNRKLENDVAIVVRGMFDPFFTPLVLKQIRINYPNHYVVLSTWDDTPSKLLKNIYADHIILNKKPEYKGKGHRNYQIQCVTSALEFLKKDNFKEIFIQRTDQMFFRNKLIDRCKLLLEEYPNNIGYLKNRIITSNLYFRKYYLYNSSDLFMYGNIDDLLCYWEAPFDARSVEEIPNFHQIVENRNIQKSDLVDFYRNEESVESYLFKNMMMKFNYEFKYTLEEWLHLASNLFIIRDTQWWDVFWYKPSLFNGTIQNFKEGHPLELIDQLDWEDMQI